MSRRRNSRRSSLRDVDRVFTSLAGSRGQGLERRALARCCATLFARATARRAGLPRRLLFGELRQGALEGVLIEAVARAANVPPAASGARRCWPASLGDRRPRGAHRRASRRSARSPSQLLRPVQPMLARLGRDVDAGARRSSATRRSSTSSTARACRSTRPATRCASSRATLQRRHRSPRRKSSTRVRALPAREPDSRRRSDRAARRRLAACRSRSRCAASAARSTSSAAARELPLTPFFFDCLYADGARARSTSRTSASHGAAPSCCRRRSLIPRIVTADRGGRRRRSCDEALARGHEGVMAKALDAPYAAGRRGASLAQGQAARTRSTSWCSRPNGATAAARAG